MNLIEIAVVLAAGIVAGTANVVAGAGSLLTFPILVALGLPPLTANVTNDVGVVPGNLSGVVGVRAGLRGQREAAAGAGAPRGDRFTGRRGTAACVSQWGVCVGRATAAARLQRPHARAACARPTRRGHRVIASWRASQND